MFKNSDVHMQSNQCSLTCYDTIPWVGTVQYLLTTAEIFSFPTGPSFLFNVFSPLTAAAANGVQSKSLRRFSQLWVVTPLSPLFTSGCPDGWEDVSESRTADI